MFPFAKRVSELSIEENEAVPERFYRDNECHHCSTLYKERDNLGQLCCRLHPGIIQLKHGQQFYTCCNRPINSPGCLRSDHISQKIPLSFSNQEERHTTLTNLSTELTPTDYYRFGIRPPLTQNILFHRRKGTSPLSSIAMVHFKMPFSTERKKEFLLEKEYISLRKSFRKHPLLVYYKRSLENGKMNGGNDGKGRRARIERGWRGSLWEEAVASDDDEDDDEANALNDSTNYKKIDIPFVIIKRFDSASDPSTLNDQRRV